MTTDNPDSTLSTEIVRTKKRQDFAHTFNLAYLEPGQRYQYEIVADGSVIERPYPLSFQTQELWQYRRDPPPFTVAFGSCAYVNDPQHDRPGDPYGGGYRIFESVAAMDPDLMLWTSDDAYSREMN